MSTIHSKDQLPQSIMEARKKLNLSREAFAKLIGVSWIAVRRWETQVAEPSLENYRRLLPYLTTPSSLK